jgi:DNA-binding transcriptional ArsR family regulator
MDLRSSPPPRRVLAIAGALLQLGIHESGHASFSTRWLAQHAGYAQRTVQLALSELADAGAVVVEYDSPLVRCSFRSHSIWDAARALMQP